MTQKQPIDISRFYIAGINYRKSDASIRGHFAISNEYYTALLASSSQNHIDEFFVLSTCNRTEIYGVASSPNSLIDLLCTQTVGNVETFKKMAYIKRGYEAIEHLFAVAAGLDSQILGDYEIVGQLKLAVKLAREYNCIGAFLDRLVNIVLQASKNIKNNTQLSGGTVSVSFAAIQFLKDNVLDISSKKIVLLGTGKIGRNTCKNVVDYLQTTNITLINRTEDKAVDLANELGLRTAPYTSLETEVFSADVVIVATNSDQPIIFKETLQHSNSKVLIDLSIPNNVDPHCNELAHITLVNVDDLSKINDATLQNREAEVPKAKSIIQQYINEFTEWYQMRKNVPVITAVKSKLLNMQSCVLYTNYSARVSKNIKLISTEDRIQKVINNMAQNMRKQNKGGCNYIEAINDFMAV
ncbi:MAG: glutamyl-tRNA reductase [Deinococcales bacterium]|nr:glutamyl-tRNA reductase [Chitinophagaceae bacterium]